MRITLVGAFSMHQKYLPQALRFFSPFFDEDEEGVFSKMPFTRESGLTVSEDDSHIHVEAAVPGLKAGDIEVTFENGVLWIKGERKEEERDRNKKFYKKAMSSFSYHLAIPSQIDSSKEPEAVLENGIMKVTFSKIKKETPKKIHVQQK